MKKTLLLFSFLVLIVLAVSAQQGGFTGPSLQLVTVEQARTLRDDTNVRLQGRILQALGDEYYLFADDTGTITVEIDNRLWRGLSVSEDDKVEITGEVEVDRHLFRRRVKIEVGSIRKLENS